MSQSDPMVGDLFYVPNTQQVLLIVPRHVPDEPTGPHIGNLIVWDGLGGTHPISMGGWSGNQLQKALIGSGVYVSNIATIFDDTNVLSVMRGLKK